LIQAGELFSANRGAIGNVTLLDGKGEVTCPARDSTLISVHVYAMRHVDDCGNLRRISPRLSLRTRFDPGKHAAKSAVALRPDGRLYMQKLVRDWRVAPPEQSPAKLSNTNWATIEECFRPAVISRRSSMRLQKCQAHDDARF